MLVKAGSKDNTRLGLWRLAMNVELGYDTAVANMILEAKKWIDCLHLKS
jgi:hypothetical protein